MPAGPYTTNDEVISVGIGGIENVEAEHQVSHSLQNIGLVVSAEQSTISGLVPPAVVIEDTPFEADDAEAITTLSDPPPAPPGETAFMASEQNSGQTPFEPTAENAEPQGPELEDTESEDIEPEDTELDDSDEDLWDDLDSLFEDGPDEMVTADESSDETAPGPSAMLLAGAPSEPAPEPSTEQSSQPPAVSTPAATVEEGTAPPANLSPAVIGVPPPATQEILTGSQTDPSLTVAVNSHASSNSTGPSSSLAPSSSNSAQSLSSLTQLQSNLPLASSMLVASAIVDAYSSTHIAYPSASAAAANSPLSTTSATTSTQPEGLSLRKVGWSSLPAEIREEVYKELLLVDMRQEQRDLCHHHLHIEILRVDRETYKEASDILYLRNTWVQIGMDSKVRRYIELRINDVEYRKGRPTVRLYPVAFSRVAALNIVVYNKKENKLPRHTYIVSSFAMPQICRMLTMSPMRTRGMPALGLKLDSATTPEGAMWDQNGLLDCFVETRGLEALKYTKRIAMLAERRGKDGLAQLGAIALPWNRPAEVVERASTYLSRGRQQVRAKHLYKALTTFQEGADYVHWLTSNPYGISLAEMSNSEAWTHLARKQWDFIKECVDCCWHLRDMTSAKTTLLSLFRRTYGPRMNDWARAYHALGVIEEALGAKNAAAYSFLRALHARPGFKETNKAIDRLRERVGDKTDIEHVIVRHNIDNVLKPFRHQTPGQTPLSEAESRRIIAQFVGQIHELDPLHSYANNLQVSTALTCIILCWLISNKLTERVGNHWYLKLLSAACSEVYLVAAAWMILRWLVEFDVADNLPDSGVKRCRPSILE